MQRSNPSTQMPVLIQEDFFDELRRLLQEYKNKYFFKKILNEIKVNAWSHDITTLISLSACSTQSQENVNLAEIYCLIVCRKPSTNDKEETLFQHCEKLFATECFRNDIIMAIRNCDTNQRRNLAETIFRLTYVDALQEYVIAYLRSIATHDNRINIADSIQFIFLHCRCITVRHLDLLKNNHALNSRDLDRELCTIFTALYLKMTNVSIEKRAEIGVYVVRYTNQISEMLGRLISLIKKIGTHCGNENETYTEIDFVQQIQLVHILDTNSLGMKTIILTVVKEPLYARKSKLLKEIVELINKDLKYSYNALFIFNKFLSNNADLEAVKDLFSFLFENKLTDFNTAKMTNFYILLAFQPILNKNNCEKILKFTFSSSILLTIINSIPNQQRTSTILDILIMSMDRQYPQEMVAGVLLNFYALFNGNKKESAEEYFNILHSSSPNLLPCQLPSQLSTLDALATWKNVVNLINTILPIRRTKTVLDEICRLLTTSPSSSVADEIVKFIELTNNQQNYNEIQSMLVTLMTVFTANSENKLVPRRYTQNQETTAQPYSPLLPDEIVYKIMMDYKSPLTPEQRAETFFSMRTKINAVTLPAPAVDPVVPKNSSP